MLLFIFWCSIKEVIRSHKSKFEDTKGVIRSHKSKKTQLPKEKGQTMIFKTLNGKLKIEQHEPHYKPGMNTCAPEG